MFELYLFPKLFLFVLLLKNCVICIVLRTFANRNFCNSILLQLKTFAIQNFCNSKLLQLKTFATQNSKNTSCASWMTNQKSKAEAMTKPKKQTNYHQQDSIHPNPTFKYSEPDPRKANLDSKPHPSLTPRIAKIKEKLQVSPWGSVLRSLSVYGFYKRHGFFYMKKYGFYRSLCW